MRMEQVVEAGDRSGKLAALKLIARVAEALRRRLVGLGSTVAATPSTGAGPAAAGVRKCGYRHCCADREYDDRAQSLHVTSTVSLGVTSTCWVTCLSLPVNTTSTGFLVTTVSPNGIGVSSSSCTSFPATWTMTPGTLQ